MHVLNARVHARLTLHLAQLQLLVVAVFAQARLRGRLLGELRTARNRGGFGRVAALVAEGTARRSSDLGPGMLETIAGATLGLL